MTTDQRTYVDGLGATYTDVTENGELIKREIVYSDRVEQWSKVNNQWLCFCFTPNRRSFELQDCHPPNPSLPEPTEESWQTE